MNGFLILMVFSSVFLPSLFSILMSRTANKRLVIICSFILIVFSSLKSPASSFDVGNYFIYFSERAPLLSEFSYFDWQHYEKGFVLINSIFKTLFQDNLELGFFALNLFISTSVITIYGYVFNKLSINPLLSLGIYVAVFYFKTEIITIRFGIASSIYILSIYYLQKNKYLLSFLTLLLALQFHNGAIVCFVVFLLYKLRLDSLKVILLLLSSLVVSFAEPIKIIAALFSLPYQIVRYLNAGDEGSIKRFLMYMPFLLYVLFYPKKFLVYGNTFRVMFCSFLAAFLVGITFDSIAVLGRLNQILMVSIVILYPIIIDSSRFKFNRYFAHLVIHFWMLYMFMRQVFFNSGGTINVFW